MSLFKKITPHKLVRLLKLSAPESPRSTPIAVESLPEEGNGELRLERIKDLIIEAYSTLDETNKVLLLEKASLLEEQLLAIYRARGLQITADNICRTLKSHRKYHCRRRF